MQIAFLGLGKMGTAIAQRLIQSGNNIIVWNRTSAAARPLVDLGATCAETPIEAVADAAIVFTMLTDDHAAGSVLFDQGTLAAIPANAIHISLSTISVALAQRLEVEHGAHHQRFLSVPVFGRPNVAADGKLWLAIAGDAVVIDEVLPLLASVSRGHTIVGTRPSQANALKVAGNFMITSIIASLAEAFTVVESHGIDPAIFLETVNSALFQSVFVSNYGKFMIDPPEHPGATIKLGAKDTKLFREAAAEPAHTPTPLADLYQHHMDAAINAGRGDKDWAAGYLEQTRILAKS
jgi:3-hydroxyisobutyrate dehydrogenase-like beta-hydroxyacid dehydrogenase